MGCSCPPLADAACLALLLLALSLACRHHHGCAAATLSTASRWVLDESGSRVKLACVNWPSHLEPVLAEGLGKRPVGAIAADVAAMGFNCVRFTWPTFLVTDASYSDLTVAQSFQRLNLTESLAGIRAVVSSLGEHNLMVILDNHLSKPGWCCSNTDGSGFFGDTYFDPDVWVDGLTKMATMFAGVPNVVGMSLRNELRGPRQNVNDWYKYMQRGAEAVHAANPRVLVILSGLSFDNDLAFLNSRPVNLSFTGKVAFEVHWYSFSNGPEWSSGNANQACARITAGITRRAFYLLDRGWPVILSEFGGSYYLREGVLGLDEVYGVLDWAWCRPRNDTALRRVQALQRPLRGPGLAEAAPYTVLFHPVSGMWGFVSDSKLHVAVNATSSAGSVGDGLLCLDVGADGRSVVTNPCRCLSADNSCDPQGQWFKLVSSTRSVVTKQTMLAQLPLKLKDWKIRSF
ncbi:Endoglucanase E1 [Zea mays]|uniref:Endoglucanase E1 n=1 Tax=Zea mays TaxID=4577 RepID=A0A3L6FX33_MAIZE|nr:Endoglucanase E1 [Zea mays]